jgi:hypothetical protein
MADAPRPSRLPPPQALAAAVRDRFAAEGAVTLPGLGTLHRLHEPARVETDAEGRRVLLPPRESVRFEPAT